MNGHYLDFDIFFMPIKQQKGRNSSGKEGQQLSNLTKQELTLISCNTLVQKNWIFFLKQCI